MPRLQPDPFTIRVRGSARSTGAHTGPGTRAKKGYRSLKGGHAGKEEAEGTRAEGPDAIKLVDGDGGLDAAAAQVADPEKVALLAQTLSLRSNAES